MTTVTLMGLFTANLDGGAAAMDLICTNQTGLKSRKHPKLQSLQLHPQVTSPAGVADLEGQHNYGITCVFQDELGMCGRCKADLLHCRPELSNHSLMCHNACCYQLLNIYIFYIKKRKKGKKKKTHITHKRTQIAQDTISALEIRVSSLCLE